MSVNTWIIVVLVALFFAFLIYKMVKSFLAKKDEGGTGPRIGGGGGGGHPTQKK